MFVEENSETITGEELNLIILIFFRIMSSLFLTRFPVWTRGIKYVSQPIAPDKWLRFPRHIISFESFIYNWRNIAIGKTNVYHCSEFHFCVCFCVLTLYGRLSTKSFAKRIPQRLPWYLFKPASRISTQETWTCAELITSPHSPYHHYHTTLRETLKSHPAYIRRPVRQVERRSADCPAPKVS